MSEAVPQQTDTPVPPTGAISRLISTLRSGVRRYAAMSGVLFLLSVAAVVYWVTSGLDAGWFALQRLELPSGLRTVVLVAMLCGGGWLLIQRLARPLLRRTDDAELALLLERRFPEFQDRLITAVENKAGYPDSGELARGMLDRTVRHADSVAAGVSADAVFNLQPLRRQGWIAGLLVLSVAGTAVARPGAVQRWWKAFVLCEDRYHIRTTALEFSVIAQPGDRRLSFRETEDSLRYLHPRGADLELEMTVPDGVSETGRAWVIPERVRVDVIRFDGSRSRTYVSPSSDRTFRFILTRLQESVSIEVLAGDFRTRTPLQIEAVTPPGIDTMQATCTYPEYTGWNQLRESAVPIMGSEVSLPVGTAFELSVTANKPLQSVRMVTDFFELVGDRQASDLVVREGYRASYAEGVPLLSADGRTATAKFRLVMAAGETAADDEAADGAASESSETATPETASAKATGNWMPVPSNTSLRFFLHDEDDIISSSPESLRIRGIPDQPPVVATRTSGVSNAITRNAIIPMTGVIQDDYGLATAGFQFIVDDDTQWRPRPFRSPWTSGVTEYTLGDPQSGRLERFDVQPLQLTEGQTLALAVTATDGCTIPQPNTGRAEPIVFRIVSNEELLSLLYTRELNLRRRFEEVIDQLEQIRQDLQFHQDVARRVASAAPGEVNPDDLAGLGTSARLNGDNLRRQNNELQSIVEGFDEIIQQLLNNSIPPQQLAEDMRRDIVTPMRQVTTGLMVDADRALSRFRVAAMSGPPDPELVTESAQQVSRVITELRLILENVRDMAEFHELFQEGKYIYEDLLRIWGETRELQKKRAIEKLRLLE